MSEKMVKVSSKELQDTLNKAIKKVGGSKENDLCRYLPMSSGGYMHHFTLRKMKNQSPEELYSMVKEFIINTSNPKTVAPKPRAARGSRKRRDHISFTRSDLEHMLRIARLAGDKDLIRKLTPKRDLRTIKRELIASIRHNRVEMELWNSFVEIVTSQSSESAEDNESLAAAFAAASAAVSANSSN